MKNIEITLGGKGIGVADKASIEPAYGCNNNCIGCYAAKTSRKGSKFFKEPMVPKEYDDNAFRKSCKKSIKNGIKVVRMAKHCDPGDPALRGRIVQILEAATDEGIQIVFVTKSLVFEKEIAELLLKGNHTLHFSLGMITEAQSNAKRISHFQRYKNYGVNAKVRIVEDVTSEIPNLYKGFNNNDVIVTPMRFPNKESRDKYNVNSKKYEWIDGYYRPIEMHESWNIFTNICGEINRTVFCCNCLVNSLENSNG